MIKKLVRAAIYVVVLYAVFAAATHRARYTERPFVEPDGFVAGDQNGWRTFFQIRQPTLIEVHGSDEICSGGNQTECSNPYGIYASGLPAEHSGKKTVLQDPREGGDSTVAAGNYRALLAQVCKDGICTGLTTTGRTFAVCPVGYDEAQLWFNGFTIFGNLKSNNQDFYGNTGGYGFDKKSEGDPRAQTACATHAGQAIVRIADAGGK